MSPTDAAALFRQVVEQHNSSRKIDLTQPPAPAPTAVQPPAVIEPPKETVETKQTVAPEQPVAAPVPPPVPVTPVATQDVKTETPAPAQQDVKQAATADQSKATGSILTKIAGMFWNRNGKPAQSPAPMVVSSGVDSITHLDEKQEQDKPVDLPELVRFDHVTKIFGDKKVLDDVSFVVRDLPDIGEIIAIVGPSGCGKSTVLKNIAGLSPHYPPTTGTISLFGQPATNANALRGLID